VNRLTAESVRRSALAPRLLWGKTKWYGGEGTNSALYLDCVLAAPQTGRDSMADIDDLAATFEQIVAAVNRRDAGAYSNFWHEQIVAFPASSPFPVDGKATLRQAAEANLGNVESLTATPINPQCRVIGTTGIVWGHLAVTIKPKDGTRRAIFERFTFTFAKVDGQWREVAVHASLLPSGS
jgi:ketosteroid isomerase-like protein